MTDPRPGILVIDDTPANLQLLGSVLEVDFRLQIATSGATGLRLAARSPPDLILLDVMMPEMDGYETCRRLKADPHLKTIPVIFVTALTNTTAEAAGLGLGAADFITKPINVDIARQRIKNLIEREQLRKSVEESNRSLEKELGERKQIEETLKGREIELRTIIETEPECVKVLDRDCKLIQMNRAGLVMIEADSLDQVRGQSVLGIVAAEHQDAFKALTQDVFRGNSGVLEFRIIGLKGGHRWLETHAVPLRDSEGIIISLLGITRDITKHKQDEAELKRSNAELEQFSYAVSHDMRQPLRMISSYMKLLENDIASHLGGPQREYFNFAIDGARRMDEMMVGLLEYSRVGRKGEPPARIESRTLLDEALLFLQPAIAEAQANVSIQGEWPQIVVSPNEMLRLMQNLIGNALKFRVAGRTPEVSVTSEIVGNEWRVCVSDNGVGIIPDQIGRLFQVFQRLQSRADYEGTGIGLALCRKIAEHHHGRIWAESAGENMGSTFTFSLPMSGENAE